MKLYSPLLTMAFLLLLGGCATYKALPLPGKSDLADSLPPQIMGKVGHDRILPDYPVNLSDGLDMTETAIIAVLRNPDLKAVRSKAKVAEAEAFAAGLLPDPQFSGGIDYATTAGYTTGYNAGLALDLRAFMTHPVDKRIATDKQKSLNMDILWQEWQTIQKARSLYAQKYFTAQKLALLQTTVSLYAKQAAHSRKALKAGDTTLDQAGSDLVALMDARSELNTQQRASLDTNQQLNTLLGLSPDVSLRLQGLSNPAMPSDNDVYAALALLPQHRPDLIALQAAYASEEETLYKAVLEQFPDITIGPAYAIDTSNVHSVGPAITINLPIFNGNRGEIAVQKATRAQLRQEYQARLDQSHAEALTLWRQTQLLMSQLNEVSKEIPGLESMASRAEKAYRAGDLPAQTYISVKSSLLKKRMEYLDLQQSIWTNRIGLDTLLAWPPVPSFATNGKASHVH